MRGAGARPGPSADSKYPGPGGGGSRDDLPTLRVTNVSEDVEEDDLRELFQKAIGGEKGGRIARVYVGKDRETGAKKGYAFVSFESREVAQRAIDKVHGKGQFTINLLRIEHARLRLPRQPSLSSKTRAQAVKSCSTSAITAANQPFPRCFFTLRILEPHSQCPVVGTQGRATGSLSGIGARRWVACALGASREGCDVLNLHLV